jgi:hypothetical protein
MRKSFVFGFLAIALVSQAEAQELRIGHLEATDDPGGINWVFFHCEQKDSVLECDMFQTLIQHELSQDQRAAYVNESMRDDPLKLLTDKGFCEGMAATMDAMRTGKWKDGRPVSRAPVQSILLVFGAADQACRNPNLNTARQFFEAMADQKMKTCKVLNDYSHSSFKWNSSNQSWVFQNGPSGPCAIIATGTLERDRNANSAASKLAAESGLAGFWLYTERHIYTNRSGVLGHGLSCNEFADLTLHYTWQAAPNSNFGECAIIENNMN